LFPVLELLAPKTAKALLDVISKGNRIMIDHDLYGPIGSMIAIYLLWNNFGWVGCYSYGLICAMGYL
jgi:hypothetical protein